MHSSTARPPSQVSCCTATAVWGAGRLPHTSLPGVTPGAETDGDMSLTTYPTLSFASGFLFWLDAAQAMAAMGLLGAVCGTLARAWPQRQNTTRWAAPAIFAAAAVAPGSRTMDP